MEMVGANFVVENKRTGKPIFEMKRKDNADYGGVGNYYIFKIHEDNFDDPDTRDIFMNQGWSHMKTLAKMMGVPLFSIDEMGEQMQAKAKEIMDSGVDLDKQQVDIDLMLMNYATGDTDKLTIGVSTKPVSEME